MSGKYCKSAKKYHSDNQILCLKYLADMHALNKIMTCFLISLYDFLFSFAMCGCGSSFQPGKIWWTRHPHQRGTRCNDVSNRKITTIRVNDAVNMILLQYLLTVNIILAYDNCFEILNQFNGVPPYGKSRWNQFIYDNCNILKEFILSFTLEVEQIVTCDDHVIKRLYYKEFIKVHMK